MDNKILIVLILGIVIVSGCSGINTGTNNANKKYYQGYDSLDMKFMTDSPPSLFYYDHDSMENEIPILVQITNKGASDAYGALYVHGYDPGMIQVAGGLLPNANTVNWNPSALSLSIAGVYIGFRPTGSGGSLAVGSNFIAPNGARYGFSAFTQDGKVRGLYVNINTNRIGGRLGQYAFGTFSNYFGYNSIISLEGDTPETPNGGMEVYEFPAYIYNLPDSLDQFTQPIMITACFDYATRATAMMCVDPAPNSNVKKACKVKAVSMSGGQGAPVSVTKVDQRASNNKVVFTIDIKHNRKNALDDVFDYQSLLKCDPQSGSVVKATDKNVVYIGYISLSGRDITSGCSPSNRVRLDDSGWGQINCAALIDSGSPGAYEAPLEIELWYGYSKSIYKQIIIKRI
jgi:hypothetical protein